MDQGYTIMPMIAYDEQGREVIDYDHAVVEDHSIRRQQYDEVQNQQEQYITEFSDGSRQHYYDIDEQGEFFDEGQHVIDQFEEGDQWEDEEEYEDDEDLDEEFVDAILDTVYEHICDEDTYDEMMLWAEDNVSDEEIDDYNEVMDSGDGEAMLRYIYALYQLYIEDEDPNDY